MKHLVSTVLVVALLLGLGALAVLARGGGAILAPAGNAVAAAAQPQTAAAPDSVPASKTINYDRIALDNGISLASELVSDVNSTPGATAVLALKWGPNGGWAV